MSMPQTQRQKINNNSGLTTQREETKARTSQRYKEKSTYRGDRNAKSSTGNYESTMMQSKLSQP